MRWRSISRRPSGSLPGLGLELLLEGGQFGKRGVRIRLAVAALLVALPLDEGSAQFRITVRPVGAVTVAPALAPPLAPLVAVRTAAVALRAGRSLTAPRRNGDPRRRRRCSFAGRAGCLRCVGGARLRRLGRSRHGGRCRRPATLAAR